MKSVLSALLAATALFPTIAQAQRFETEARADIAANGPERRGDGRAERGDRGARPDRPDRGQRQDAGPQRGFEAQAGVRVDRGGPDRGPGPGRQDWQRGDDRNDRGAGFADVRRGPDPRRSDDRGFQSRNVDRGIQRRSDDRGFQPRSDDRRGYQGRDGYRGDDRFQGQARGQVYGRSFDQGQWNRGWRNDQRYDWNRYRGVNRQAYRLPRYYAPGGYGGYRRFSTGFTLSGGLFARNYWIQDPWTYRLPDAYGPYRWVRYYDDALLVDVRSGVVVDTVYGIFW